MFNKSQQFMKHTPAMSACGMQSYWNVIESGSDNARLPDYGVLS